MTATDDKAAFLARLREFEGMQAGPPTTARDPVNRAMIHHWCDAIGDDNPIYLDEDLAAQSVHGTVVAPPAMMQAWTMPGLRPPPGSQDSAVHRLRAVAAEAGFPSVIATNYEQEYFRYLRPGDVLTSTTVVESVSEEKGTGLGPGHFVTTKATYTDAAGEAVGTSVMRLLLYRPEQQAAPAAAAEGFTAPQRTRAPRGRDNVFFWEGVEAGELRIQRCGGCGELRHPPRPMCRRCHSLEWDHVVASGRAALHSFVVHHRPVIPGYDPPYVVGLVDLEEGTRIVSNVVGVDPDEVEIGMPLECRMVEVEPGHVLPQFFPAGG